MGVNPKLAVLAGLPAIPYYGYGAGVIRRERRGQRGVRGPVPVELPPVVLPDRRHGPGERAPGHRARPPRRAVRGGYPSMTEAPLAGQIAWVTGSSRGLGRVMAEHLGRLGADLVVHGTTQTSARAFGEGESLDHVAREVAARTGRRVLAVPADLTRADQVQSAVARIRAEYGRIDVLVNNAGGDIGPAGATGPRRRAAADQRRRVHRAGGSPGGDRPEPLLVHLRLPRGRARDDRAAGRPHREPGERGRAERASRGRDVRDREGRRARVHALPRRAAPAVQRHRQLRGAGRDDDAALRRDGPGAARRAWRRWARWRATASRRTSRTPSRTS